MFIYFIRNNINNKIYIGSTNNFERRKKQHLKMIENKKHKNKKINEDLKVFSINDFSIELVSAIGNVPDYWLRLIETMYMSVLNGAFTLYNVNYSAFGYRQKMPPFQDEKDRILYRIFRKQEKEKAVVMAMEQIELATNRCIDQQVEVSPF